MSRRRYLTTDISKDGRVNTLARKCGDFAALLYTWMIPHADDRACLQGTPEEIMYEVVPGRRDKTVEDVVAALDEMQQSGLIEWDRQQNIIGFPPRAFYNYQTYISPGNRRKDNLIIEQRETPQNAEVQREPAEKAASLSVSPSLSPTGNKTYLPAPSGAGECLAPGADEQKAESADTQRDCAKTAPAGMPGSGQDGTNSQAGEGLMGLTQEEPAAPTVGKVVKVSPGYPPDFDACWAAYPRQVEKRAAYKAWRARVKEGFPPPLLLTAVCNYGESCRRNDTEPRYIKQLKTFFGSDKPFEDYVKGPIIERKEKPPNGDANPIAAGTPPGDSPVNWDKFYQQGEA